MMLVCAIGAMAQTEKSKAQLTTAVNSNLPDNNSKLITPAVLRQILKDIYFSSFNKIDDANFYQNSVYVADSAGIKQGIRDWYNSTAKTIDVQDVYRWDHPKSDSIYVADSTGIKEAIRLLNAKTNIYHITLPYSTTVAGRIALATDYPAGWTLSANGVNLVVTHNLGRWCTDVKVFSVINGTQRQQLRLSAAENGLTALSANQAEVYSLSTIAKDIVVYLYFE